MGSKEGTQEPVSEGSNLSSPNDNVSLIPILKEMKILLASKGPHSAGVKLEESSHDDSDLIQDEFKNEEFLDNCTEEGSSVAADGSPLKNDNAAEAFSEFGPTSSMDTLVKKSLPIDINSISDDIDMIQEILTRIPYRSTVQCRSVSKRWRDVLSSPSFNRLSISRQQSLLNAFFIFLTANTEFMLAFWPTGFDCHSQNLRYPDILINKKNVCGSSDSFFLCCEDRHTRGKGYYVYDPLTKKCIQIPDGPASRNSNPYAVGFITFLDEYTEETSFSLNSKYHFRVVLIQLFMSRKSWFKVLVFSSVTGEWKEESVDCSYEPFAFGPRWSLSLAYGWNLYFLGRKRILQYDPFNDYSSVLHYPEGANPMRIMSFGFLGFSCEKIKIADIGNDDVRVWKDDDDDDVVSLGLPYCWCLDHTISLTENLPAEFCANSQKRVAGFHPHDDDILYLHSYADGLFAANLRTNKFEAIPGYEKANVSPFQLNMRLSLAPMPSAE